MLNNRIISFLENRAWKIKDTTGKFINLTPPPSLNLPDGFFISIPNSDNFVDFERFAENLYEIIGDIYGYSEEELVSIVNKEQTLLSVRIYDEKTKSGTISLKRFDEVIEKVKFMLLDAASSVIIKNH